MARLQFLRQVHNMRRKLIQALKKKQKSFPFSELPYELKLIVLEKFYEDVWKAYECQCARHSSLTVPMAPLMVNHLFRELATKAIRNTHSGELHMAFDGVIINHRFFDIGISTVRNHASPYVWNSLQILNPLQIVQRFHNLSRVDLGMFAHKHNRSPNLMTLLTSLPLHRVLCCEYNDQISQVAQSELLVRLSGSAAAFSNVTLQWSIEFWLQDILPRNWLGLTPRMHDSILCIQFELRQGRCRITKIDLTDGGWPPKPFPRSKVNKLIKHLQRLDRANTGSNFTDAGPSSPILFSPYEIDLLNAEF